MVGPIAPTKHWQGQTVVKRAHPGQKSADTLGQSLENLGKMLGLFISLTGIACLTLRCYASPSPYQRFHELIPALDQIFLDFGLDFRFPVEGWAGRAIRLEAVRSFNLILADLELAPIDPDLSFQAVVQAFEESLKSL